MLLLRWSQIADFTTLSEAHSVAESDGVETLRGDWLDNGTPEGASAAMM